MAASRSRVWRVLLVLDLMVLFFASVLVMLAALVYAGSSLLGRLGGQSEYFGLSLIGGITCFAVAAIVAWSILPRPDAFLPPGPEVSVQDQPALFAELNRVASAIGGSMPVHVYLVDEVNAFVAHRGGIMGFGSRRVMGLGLPLLRALTVSELRAVIAHEMGHFHGGDTRLGPLDIQDARGDPAHRVQPREGERREC